MKLRDPAPSLLYAVRHHGGLVAAARAARSATRRIEIALATKNVRWENLLKAHNGSLVFHYRTPFGSGWT